MIALAVDDEKAMLNALVKAVSASPDINEVEEFNVCSKALEWAKYNTIDIFLLIKNMNFC